MSKVLLLIFCALPQLIHAQWDWSIRGGSSNLLQTGDHNIISCLETDQAGNVYLLGVVGGDGIKCDDQSLVGYSEVGTGATVDIILSSFTDLGSHRWSKIIGGHNDDYGYCLNADSMGNIYVTGFLWNPYNNPTGPPNTAIHFDTDTVLPRVPHDNSLAYIEDSLRQSMFLVKYDTSGTFQWLRTPEPDTVTFVGFLKHSSSSLGLDIAPDGRLYWLCYLRPGKFRWETDSIITQHGVYVVEYNSMGRQIGLTQLQMNANRGVDLTLLRGRNLSYRRNHTNGDIIIAGTNEASLNSDGWMTIDGDTIQSDAYIASFSSNGQLQWLEESGGVDIIRIEDLELGGGNIYITGSVRRNTTLAGHTYLSSLTSSSPYVTCLTSNGTHVWSNMARAQNSSGSQALTIHGQEVVITGYAAGLFWKGGADTLDYEPNRGYDAFISRFNKDDGILVSMERTTTNFGGGAWGNAITAGPQNTYYFGGNFDQGMYMGQDTLFKVGGQRSFFLTKYQCDVPEPSYSIAGNNDSSSVLLTYTGPVADSVQWFMGDGTQLWGDTIQHTYTVDSSYRVCMRAYFECTDVMICDSVHVGSIGTEEVHAQDFTFYPNPTSGLLTIEDLPSTGTIQLYDSNGALLLSQTVANSSIQLDLGTYPAGMYLLEYRTDEGVSTVRKVVRR